VVVRLGIGDAHFPAVDLLSLQEIPMIQLRRPLRRRPARSSAAVEELPAPSLVPMWATCGTMPSDRAAFRYEVKWDGYRILARRDGASFMLCSRNGIDLAPRFPEVVQIARALPCNILLDGEIVVLERDGRTNFNALQTRMPGPRGMANGSAWDPTRHGLHYMVFDILHHRGRSTRGLPYAQRRALLESLDLAGPAWQVPAAHEDGDALIGLTQRLGQEAIIAKRLTSTYMPGCRSPDWIEVKVSQQEEFIVVGFCGSDSELFASLLLAAYPSPEDARAGRNLHYCGEVDSGFDEQTRVALAKTLGRLRVARPSCSGHLPRGREIVWCRPQLVAQVRFAKWTYDGALRHPVFLGLRSDKRPAEVVHALLPLPS
jgi:bifunctional non-homologous end joining protein LigD